MRGHGAKLASERGKGVGNWPGGSGNTSKSEKNTKIVGTNSISPLESTKLPRNELKTNWFLSAKEAKRTQKAAKKPPVMRNRTLFCESKDAR
jgi:hypothetical protein